MWRCLLGVFLIIPGVCPGPRYSSRIVETESGQIRGIIRELPVEPVEYFLGVPYAAPPVGERRLRPPRPPLAWSGTRLADSPAPFCPQRPPLRGLNASSALQLMPRDHYLLLSRLQEALRDQSEDCLTLNIYVPASGNVFTIRAVTGSRGEDAPYAIMVYIHGESYEWGGGHVYDVSVWSSLGHVITIRAVTGSCGEDAPYAIMVYIHGESYEWGGGHVYDVSVWSSLGHVITIRAVTGSRGEDAPYAIMVYIHGESYEWGGGHVYDVSVWSSLGHVITIRAVTGSRGEDAPYAIMVYRHGESYEWGGGHVYDVSVWSSLGHVITIRAVTGSRGEDAPYAIMVYIHGESYEWGGGHVYDVSVWSSLGHVITIRAVTGSRGEDAPYAIMVYIHGESYEWGGGHVYDVSVWSSLGHVITIRAVTGSRGEDAPYAIMVYRHGESYEWGGGHVYDVSVWSSLGHVITIRAVTGSRGEDAPYAIMVYIHGESYEWGGGHVYDVSVWSSLGHVIAVTINYRLGLLGFLKTHSGCCLALRDIEAALSWLQRNIASFGGDPGRVTLVGHDTGAALINALLLADTAAGLFRRAVLLSGSLLCPWAVAARPDTTTAQVAAQLGCPLGPELIECLRRTSLQRLLALDLPAPRFLSTFGPWFSGDVRSALDRAGDPFISRSLMVGVASTESYLDLSNHQVQEGVEEDQRNRILRTFIRNKFVYHLNELFSTVRNEYTDWDKPIIHPINLRDSLLEALSDGHTVSPVVHLAMLHSRRGSTTYMMHFNHQPRETDYIQRLGSLRGEVIPYLLGFPLVGGDSFYPSNHTRADVAVSEHLLLLATNFARTGNPNKAVQGRSEATRAREEHHRGLTWEPYNPNTQMYLSLGTKARMRSHYRGHKMSVWLNLIPQLHRPGDRDVAMRHHHFQERDHRHYDGAVRPETVTHISPPSSTLSLPETEDCENSTTEEVEGQPQPSTEDRNTPAPLAPETRGADKSLGVAATVIVGSLLLVLNVAVLSATLWQRRRQRRARMAKKLEELGNLSVETFSRSPPPTTPVRTSSLGHRTPLDDEISV